MVTAVVQTVPSLAATETTVADDAETRIPVAPGSGSRAVPRGIVDVDGSVVAGSVVADDEDGPVGADGDIRGVGTVRAEVRRDRIRRSARDMPDRSRVVRDVGGPVVGGVDVNPVLAGELDPGIVDPLVDREVDGGVRAGYADDVDRVSVGPDANICRCSRNVLVDPVHPAVDVVRSVDDPRALGPDVDGHAVLPRDGRARERRTDAPGHLLVVLRDPVDASTVGADVDPGGADDWMKRHRRDHGGCAAGDALVRSGRAACEQGKQGEDEGALASRFLFSLRLEDAGVESAGPSARGATGPDRVLRALDDSCRPRPT